MALDSSLVPAAWGHKHQHPSQRVEDVHWHVDVEMLNTHMCKSRRSCEKKKKKKGSLPQAAHSMTRGVCKLLRLGTGALFVGTPKTE